MRFRHRRTADLLEELEEMRWTLAEVMVDINKWEFPLESLNYIVTKIEDLEAESSRRRWLQHQPASPKWPNSDTERFEARKRLASALKERWTVEDYCQDILQMYLEERGQRLWGLCPLPDHMESTPSFSISPSKNVWYCFGCNRGGDVFSLVGFAQGFDHFADQLDWLEQRTASFDGTEVRRAG